jgi:plasmid stability protein
MSSIRSRSGYAFRAADHGHSMEAEARRILQTALSGTGKTPARNLYDRIHARFAPLGADSNDAVRAYRI